MLTGIIPRPESCAPQATRIKSRFAACATRIGVDPAAISTDSAAEE